MKSFATFALMATALAVKLNMLQDDDATPETTRVEDMTIDDFAPEELECISMAVEGGLREKGMKGDELDETREKFQTAAEEGATLGDGVEELRKMGEDAGMTKDDIDETLEKMFRRAHKCAEKKKERKEEGSGSEAEAELAQRELASEDERQLEELLESTAADLGEKKLKCMGKSIKEGLERRGMKEEEALAVVEVLASGAEAGKKVSEGVEYLRTVGEEAGLDEAEQDDVLLEMAGEARDCAERPTETEEEVELAQEGEDEASTDLEDVAREMKEALEDLDTEEVEDVVAEVKAALGDDAEAVVEAAKEGLVEELKARFDELDEETQEALKEGARQLKAMKEEKAGDDDGEGPRGPKRGGKKDE